MTDSIIDYGELIDEAMHHIVKKALQRVAAQGLPGNHHFFISFLTCYPGVSISEKLKRRYPDEMTIVLQYQFDALQVAEDSFSVMLVFDGVKEQIEIPFTALTAFADPSVKFGLQFHYVRSLDSEDDDTNFSLEEDNDEVTGVSLNAKKGTSKKNHGLESQQEGKQGRNKSLPAGSALSNVVTLDTFRKKPGKK